MPASPCQCAGCKWCSQPEGLRSTKEEGPCIQNQSKGATYHVDVFNGRLLCSFCRDHWKDEVKHKGHTCPKVSPQEQAFFGSRDQYRQRKDDEHYGSRPAPKVKLTPGPSACGATTYANSPPGLSQPSCGAETYADSPPVTTGQPSGQPTIMFHIESLEARVKKLEEALRRIEETLVKMKLSDASNR